MFPSVNITINVFILIKYVIYRLKYRKKMCFYTTQFVIIIWYCFKFELSLVEVPWVILGCVQECIYLRNIYAGEICVKKLICTWWIKNIHWYETVLPVLKTRLYFLIPECFRLLLHLLLETVMLDSSIVSHKVVIPYWELLIRLAKLFYRMKTRLHETRPINLGLLYTFLLDFLGLLYTDEIRLFKSLKSRPMQKLDQKWQSTGMFRVGSVIIKC